MTSLGTVFVLILGLNSAVLGAIPSRYPYPSHENRAKRGNAAKCGGAVFLGQDGDSNLDIIGPTDGAPVTCEWAVFGDSNCKPEVHCDPIILHEEEDCEDEYLQISDGLGGQLRSCGKKTFPKPFIANGKSRDLFVRLKLSGKTKGPKVTCHAKCTTTGGEEIPLEFEPKTDERCVCGLQNKDDRIVGGEDSKMMEFPWQTAMVFTGTRSPKCGAAVINDRWILTATHCFFFDGTAEADIEMLTHAFLLGSTKKDEAADVALGEDGSTHGRGYDMKEVTDADEGSQRHKVAEIIMHPLFNEGYDFDYALVRLEKKIDLAAADSPTPLCLTDDHSVETFDGMNTTVVGWGMPAANAGATTRLLQKLVVPVIPMATCEKWLPGMTSGRMLCAGYEDGKKDACTGDSGGPLIHQRANKQWEQVGVVSWGVGCAEARKPGMYARVTEMQQWIKYHANEYDAKWCREHK